MTRRTFSLSCGSLLAGAWKLGAQTGQAEPAGHDEATFHVDADLVNAVFTVRKASNGELTPDLTKDDFLLFEDGKPQTIAHFSRERDLPIGLGMLVDVSRSQTNLIETERSAGSAFLSDVIRPKDEAFLLAFGHDTVLMQDYTGSIPKLKAALDLLRVDAEDRYGGGPGSGNGGGGGRGGGRGGGMGWPGGGTGWPGGGGMGGRRGGGGGRPGGGPPPGGSSGRQNHKGTLMFDAIYLACNDETGHKEGRKALLLITDGEDRGSYYSRGQAIEAAQRADTILYSIYYADPKMDRGRGGHERGNGMEDLERLAGETGGRVFRVAKEHTLEDSFTELQAELRSQYSLGYKPTKADRNGEYREIEIRPKNPAYAVQARKGYYAVRSDAKANPS